jgi:hypothetical protein
MELPDLVAAKKEIEGFTGWSEPEPDTGGMWFSAPLSVAGVIQEAFTLHGLALKNVPDRNVVFELKVSGPKGRQMPVARFEWRSLRKGHTNPRRKGSPVSGKRVDATHYHSFDLNWIPLERRMRGRNLSQADSFHPDPESFESLIDVVGKLFRINNMYVVPPPKWEYDMFQNG